MMKSMKHTLLLLLAAGLSTACTQDELSNGNEGAQPLVLRTDLRPLATRTTPNGEWKGGEKVSVQVENTTPYEYTAGTDGTLTSVAPYYWQGQASSIDIKAWSFGGGEYHDLADSWIVPADQSDEDKLASADVLYAQKSGMTYVESLQEEGALKFYHQNAKIVVNILNEGFITGFSDPKLTLNIVNVNNTGTFTFPTAENNFGSWTTNSSGAVSITAYSLPTSNTVNDKPAVASFEAIVLPQRLISITGDNLLEIEIANDSKFAYSIPSSGITWESGKVYTYNITLVGTGRVEVSNITVSPWTPQDGGSLTTE